MAQCNIPSLLICKNKNNFHVLCNYRETGGIYKSGMTNRNQKMAQKTSDKQNVQKQVQVKQCERHKIRTLQVSQYSC